MASPFKAIWMVKKILITPEKSIDIQENLGSNIMMVLDECLGIPTERKKVEQSIALTTRWAVRSLKARNTTNRLFAIVQGADFDDLRLRSAEELMQYDFDGFAIGGLSVGESKEIMSRVCGLLGPILPSDKPRYLMGVGDPVDLLEAVERGIDMFDCVLATRNARNGGLFTFNGKMSIKQARYKEDSEPIDENCGCEVCQHYSRAYLRHLYQANEILSSRLNSYHNLYFFKELMNRARTSILKKEFFKFKQNFLSKYQNSSD